MQEKKIWKSKLLHVFLLDEKGSTKGENFGNLGENSRFSSVSDNELDNQREVISNISSAEKKISSLFRYEGKGSKVFIVGEWSDWKDYDIMEKAGGELFILQLVIILTRILYLKNINSNF